MTTVLEEPFDEARAEENQNKKRKLYFTIRKISTTLHACLEIHSCVVRRDELRTFGNCNCRRTNETVTACR